MIQMINSQMLLDFDAKNKNMTKITNSNIRKKELKNVTL